MMMMRVARLTLAELPVFLFEVEEEEGVVQCLHYSLQVEESKEHG